MAFLEPQECVWEGQSGRQFALQNLQGSDHLNCLHGISNFGSRSATYGKTLFRFPLRSAASKLSDNVYTLKKVNTLIDALRSEAKLLLLFLRSVHTIEVYNIDHHGRQTLSFQAKIADAFVTDVKQKRGCLLKDLKSCHKSHGYNYSHVLQFMAKFDVSVSDSSTGLTSTSHWLVANQVGSKSPAVRAAAVKQKVFPWVGTAVEIDNPGNGRIFCFLPMPIETASNLPVHVNGTFGLNDDRRSLKWPGMERRNDPMADWNKMLVTDVIPACYIALILEYKHYVSAKTQFYDCWPSVQHLRSTQWVSLMGPVFKGIMNEGVIWCEAQTGVDWVTASKAAFIPSSGPLVGVVKSTLTSCGVKLADVPANVKAACKYVGVCITEVTPKFVRDKLRANPRSYTSLREQDKRQLLKYCLSDGKYNDLVNLQLLPLSNGVYTSFRANHASAPVYMCTSAFPKWLLPNLDHKLVDVTEDADLNCKMSEIAQGNWTHLRLLSMSNVPALLDEAMSRWKNQKAVTFPNAYYPSDWFQKIWNWIQRKQLQVFQNKLVVPVLCAHNVSAGKEFRVIKLASSQPVLYFPSHSSCSKTMLSVLDKLDIQCCSQESFPYVHHPKLANYIKQYSPDALLEVIALNGGDASAVFTSKEAEFLRSLFYQVRVTMLNKTELQNLKIFSSCVNSSYSIHSVSQMHQSSLLKQVIVQPTVTIDMSAFPADVIVFSSEYYQAQLLGKLGHEVTNGVYFLTQHIFPKLPSMSVRYIDAIMTRVLDMYETLRHSSSSISSAIKSLGFVKVAASGTRKRPCDLYDPSVTALSQIYAGEDVFPSAPYDKYVGTLRLCGLRTSIEAQEILNLIQSISLQPSSHPQKVDPVKLLRVRAIMEYISSHSFQSQSIYTVDTRIKRGGVSFSAALKLLCTHRSWLPVLAEKPRDYPTNLPWKGSEYTSHVVSVQGSVCISNSFSSTLPLLYGSQAYFTATFDSVPAEEPKGCLAPHFQEVIRYKGRLTPEEVLTISKHVYCAMARMVQSSADIQHVLPFKSKKDWVYLMKCHKFVSIDSVASKLNPGFGHNMEPYLHILPDSISSYSQLFRRFGMNETISESQVVSILSVIRKEIAANQCSVRAEEAWGTVMAILNWLTEDGTKATDNDSLYVPAESDSSWPDLREPKDLVYTDNEFLKTVIGQDGDRALIYVHRRVNQNLAKSLGITPLTEELDISEDTFEDAGQHEPLIVRLKNILQDYKDGITIVKELIQNADDAEATEVDVCFDNRQHTTEQKRLFFPDMCQSHGPALVIHNNSKFSDEDFTNIQKLAGGTKQSKHLKIGKFGIGFCSVYHVTDVPSFVSRDRLYIFDPTLNHLKKAVKNHSQPGKKVNYLTKFIQKSKQMEPYEGLFGFKKSEEYNGTMFRLPFRTNISELSTTCYSQSTVSELLRSIEEASDKLLLFLQNVRRITVRMFEHGMTSPEVLCEIRKPSIPASLAADSPSIITIVTEKSSSKSSNSWLVGSHSDTYNRKPALANVACLLGVTRVLYAVNNDLSGEMFCFLPLSQATGLPIHVSCNFAVVNNRRGIWTTSHDAEDSSEVQWNNFLMKSVIPVAYTKLLCSLKAMFRKNELENYKFHSLWPLTSDLEQKNPWEECVKALYVSLSQSELFYSESSSQWLCLSASKFLDPGILGQSNSSPCILDVVHHLKLPLVHLPPSYKTHLNLTHERLTELDFVKLFFAHLPKLSTIGESRDIVIMHMLEAYASQYDSKSKLAFLLERLFADHMCIPTAPDGSVLRRCKDIVDPDATFAGLYDESDHRFPLDMLTRRHLAMTALDQAGMMHSTLSWGFIIERAQSVGALMKVDRLKALGRVQLIIKTISDAVNGKPPSSGTTIDSVNFLPVMRKPKDYPLPWYGDSYKLSSGKQLVLSETYNHVPWNSDRIERLAGSQAAFLCENLPKDGGCGFIKNRDTKTLLHLRLSPSLDEVIGQLKTIIDQFSSSNSPQLSWITATCDEIYRFVETALSHEQRSLGELTSIPCIWNGKKFLSASCLANNWKLSDGPFLYRTPPSVASKERLSRALGIKDNFSAKDAQKALVDIKSRFISQPIDELCEQLLTEVLSIFQHLPPDKLGVLKGKVYLPDTHNILHKSCDLVFNDVEWAPVDKSNVQVSKKLTRELAIGLGVKLVTSKILEQYKSKKPHFRGVSFGQHEELTRRIQNIIREYPFNETLLKELLQNADDAKATKMYAILDKRQHGESSVLSEKWQELQGPALLVWNDSVFTEKDLEGIQRLGLGSKRGEAESIGQYGVGFNVVYHLTDCPSFITDGDTLCVLDPHCRYVPEAKEALPGARYDNLKNGFWRDFADVRSAYLQDELPGLPEELLGGSLFRLPIRHTDEMVKSSKIVDTLESASQEPLTARKLSSMMHTVMPMMKQAMFFLNHVTEIKYLEIDSVEGVASVQTKFHFQTEITMPTDCYEKSLKRLQNTISNFTTPQGSQSCIIQYPLSITEFSDGKKKVEEWFVQQGVGDIDNEDQYWQYVKTVKPRHAIAAPLKIPHEFEKRIGHLFCFLPLPEPVSSGVPVHINGSFILHSSRQDLWKSQNPKGGGDDRSRWNVDLFQAIASAYARFLIQARHKYLSKTYTGWKHALNDIHNYYHLFPRFYVTKKWHCEVYRALIQCNAEILCVLVSTKSKPKITVEWHPVASQAEANQVHFWPWNGPERKIIHPVLQSIGMKITPAPPEKMDCFNAMMKELHAEEKRKQERDTGSELVDGSVEAVSVEVECQKIPSVSPATVFEYYTKLSSLSFMQNLQPCQIKKTPFKDVDTFLVFIKYLLGIRLKSDPKASSSMAPTEGTTKELVNAFESGEIDSSLQQPTSSEEESSGTFPSSPFSHFLLLSADEMLRSFDANCKPLNSEYFELFPTHKDKFLHPALRVANLSPSYFISSEDKEKNEVADQVLSIFEGSLPCTLRDQKIVLDASNVISEEVLSKFWNCFRDDEVLACFLPKILKNWALLLTTDNRLFSTNNEVLPSYLPFKPDDIIREVVGIMKRLRIPFLKRSVVSAAVNCPMLCEHTKILSYFYHINKKSTLTSVIKDTSQIETLISYFAQAANPSEEEWVGRISSLPFFEDVMGKYLPLVRKRSIIWPRRACAIGYTCWTRNENMLFVKDEASWSSLGSAKQLNIRSISAEQLYTDYIFPKFDLLNEADRYKHLEHIKRVLYSSAKGYKDMTSDEYTSDDSRLAIADATSFIATLTSLHCIGPDDSILQPIRAFCNHEVEIFTVFSSEFHMLPEELRSHEWREFFKELGLKQELCQQEFLKLCDKTARREFLNVQECSKVLLEYLFSFDVRTTWSGDKRFLRQVASIAFVHTCNTSSVDWIVQGKCLPNQLVELNRAASHMLMKQVWTVRPIIHLPRSAQVSILHRDEETTSLLTNLGIAMMASVSDVTENLHNICCSCPYTDEVLFDNYPERLVAPEGTNLLNVMHENLKVLNNPRRPKEEFRAQDVKNLPCIPVYCNYSQPDERKMVLVKPSSVLAHGCDISEYHPYLHSIPMKLKDLMQLQTEIGIKNSLEPTHMQIVLEKIFHCSQGEVLDPNAMKIVGDALKFLHSKLFTLQGEPASLSPLYLPDVENVLKPSTTMLYGDTGSYFGHIKLRLTGTPYSHFDIVEGTYGIAALDLCRLLPERVQPLGMSTKCRQIPDESCYSIDHSEISNKVEEMLRYELNPTALAHIYKKFVPSKTITDKLERVVEKFFSSIKVITKQNFESQIVLRESDRVIGHIKSCFYLESDEIPRTLYISEDFDDEEDIASEIVEHLFEEISETFPAQVPVATKMKMLNLMMKFLKAKPSKKLGILSRFRIEISSVCKRPHFSFRLGEEIPEYYQNRLDQHPQNIFRPMEYVGYEDRDSHMVVAQIMYLVESEEANPLEAKYHIYTRVDDEEGKKVSILDLYKFLTGSQKSRGPVELAVVPFSEEREVTRSLYEGDLAEIKKRVSTELEEIWKLDRVLRNKAVKRLYLRWHPDKNLDNPERAKEIFLFVKSEIERLERADDAGDDDAAGDDTNTFTSRGEASNFNFPVWNSTANRHRAARTHQEERQRSHPQSASNPFEQVNEQKRPDEGERWVKQAEMDYKALCDLHTKANTSKCFSHVCFMAHQVAEKALKGGVYALCGMDGRGTSDHNLTRHVYAVQNVQPEHTQELSTHSIPLENYYLETRYPNRWSGYTDIPSDHYSSDDADTAKYHAQTVLDVIKSIMPIV